MLREELKKIWRPGMLVLLAVLGLVFYTMFLEFYIRYFPNGPHQEGIYQVGIRLVKEYGAYLSPEEAGKVEAGLPALYEEADGYLQSFALASSHGIDSYEAYERFRQEINETVKNSDAADRNQDYADTMVMENYLTGQETDNIEGRIYGTRWYLRRYRSAQEKESGQDDWQNILPYEVPEAASDYMGYLLVWICLSVCLLLSPLLVRDRMSRMAQLQYSSRRGRRLFCLQFGAVMLSAFVLTTMNLLIFGSLFAAHGTRVFFPCRMYSFAGNGDCIINWTHGAWCLMLVVMSYLTALGTAAIAFFLSQYSANYIAMLLKLIPLFTIIALLAPRITGNAFYTVNGLYQLTGLPFVELYAAAGILTVGIVLWSIAWKRKSV